MAISDVRKYTGEYIYNLLESVTGRTLGEVDDEGSRQFDRTAISDKITGIAGDVIEQSVFCYGRDSKQECDIEIDGTLVELKTTGVRVPKKEYAKLKGKPWQEYKHLFCAKEGISITGVTFVPDIQRDFETSHFWEKSRNLLIVFYEYKGYNAIPASGYRNFPIVGYCRNTFSDEEREKLQTDWEIVRDHIDSVYSRYSDWEQRNRTLEGFTHTLRTKLLLIELVPGFKRKHNGSYQKPRYRLKKTFIDDIVKGHFTGNRDEVSLKDSFNSYAALDAKCHRFTELYGGKTIAQLEELLGFKEPLKNKSFSSQCILKMFDVECSSLNKISDFNKAGIITKTITMTAKGGRTEDMKLASIDFEEWCDRDLEFEESDVYNYFSEHSFLCPIFKELDENDFRKTVFEGFKRFAFDEEFFNNEIRRTWTDIRRLVHNNELVWEYKYDKDGNIMKNKSGSDAGAPNFPKSSEYVVFLRGGATDSSDKYRTECVNGIYMIPQFFWIQGKYIVNKLSTLPFL